MTKPLTVRDIAEKAGVSLGTVSRVMNNAANIDPALKEHTLTVIRENNYIPLRRPRRNTRRSAAEGGRIAMLFCDMPHQWNESYFSRSYAAGIEAVCTAYRVETEFFTLQDLCGDTFFRRLAKFDGVLIKHNFGPGDPRAERINALAEKIPVAGFGTNFPHCRYSQTFLDNHSAGALAARELIGRGHRVIAFINPNPESEMLRSRGEGFREMMEQSGLWRPELFISRKLATVAAPDPDPVPPLLGGTLERLLAFPEKVTAAIVANDWGCVGLYRACAERGISIPQELSILGFDNQISICASLNPPLSSINNPLADIGKTAAIELFSRIDARKRELALPVSRRILSGTLIERGSLSRLTRNSNNNNAITGEQTR